MRVASAVHHLVRSTNGTFVDATSGLGGLRTCADYPPSSSMTRITPSGNKGLGGRTPTIAVNTREAEPFSSRSWEPPRTELGIVHEVATGIERGTIQGADCFLNRNRGLGICVGRHASHRAPIY